MGTKFFSAFPTKYGRTVLNSKLIFGTFVFLVQHKFFKFQCIAISDCKFLPPWLEKRLHIRRRPAAAHQEAAAVGRAGFCQRCCCGSPCAVPACPIRFLRFLRGLRRGCHFTADPHGRCRKRSTLSHILESR